MWLVGCVVVSALISQEALRRLDILDNVKMRNIVILTIMIVSFFSYSFVERLTSTVHFAALAGVLSALLCAWIIAARHASRRSHDDLPSN